MSNTIRIVAAVVDTRQLTLYKEDGTTITIPQGDPRLRRIVEQASLQLTSQGWADVEINQKDENPYVQFEEQSNGMVKFFRIAKEKLKQLMELGLVEKEPFVDTVGPMTVGSVPSTTSQAVAGAPASVVPAPRTVASVVEEIIANATPAGHADFHEDGIAKQGNVVEDDGRTDNQRHDPADTAPDTMIAVVNNRVIPGVEKIKSQFSRAAKLGSTVGVENFLKRIGGVIEKRSHSVEDLLKFMERGDLPIADDGSILIYKVLRRSGDKYVDCHSRQVEQWVGAYVCMDESLVDRNRNNECSNGLHVARRGYLSGFSGDVCVLAKLAPEDVITVPTYDANKMRVCGYHILFELTPEQYNRLKSNQAMTDTEYGRVLLGKAIAGDHIGKTHEVRITRQQGGGVVVKKLNQATPEPVEEVKEAVALENKNGVVQDAPINPKDVAKNVAKLSRAEQAKLLYAAWADGKPNAEAELRAFKKASKVGWSLLGIPTGKDGQPVPPKASTKATSPQPGGKGSNKQVETVKLDGEQDRRGLDLDDDPDHRPLKPPSKRKIDNIAQGEGSPRERIQKLLAIGLEGKGVAQAILNIKKASKKSWDALGVAHITVDNILKRTSNG